MLELKLHGAGDGNCGYDDDNDGSESAGILCNTLREKEEKSGSRY